MGRYPTRWLNLPKGMRARPRGKKTFYYLDQGGKPRKEIALGSDYAAAVRKWAELVGEAPPAKTGIAGGATLKTVFEGYWEDIIPAKAPRTRADNEDERDKLYEFFGDDAPLANIEPVHIQNFLDWRVRTSRAAAEKRNDERRKKGLPVKDVSPTLGAVRANREKALFSHMWNYARTRGHTKLPNPCAGVTGFAEEGRDVLVEDDLIARVMEHADKPLEFSLRLAKIIGQRPSDTLRAADTDVSGDILRVTQGKTKAELRIVIVGELKELLDEMGAYKAQVSTGTVRPLALLVNERGEALTYSMFRNRFDDAREAAGIDKNDFQFRDLRARAATDTDEAGGTRDALALLGHTTEGMTTKYIRRKVGKKVVPFK